MKNVPLTTTYNTQWRTKEDGHKQIKRAIEKIRRVTRKTEKKTEKKEEEEDEEINDDMNGRCRYYILSGLKKLIGLLQRNTKQFRTCNQFSYIHGFYTKYML